MRQTQLLIHLITGLMYSKKMGQQALGFRCYMPELAVTACSCMHIFFVFKQIRFVFNIKAES